MLILVREDLALIWKALETLDVPFWLRGDGFEMFWMSWLPCWIHASSLFGGRLTSSEDWTIEQLWRFDFKDMLRIHVSFRENGRTAIGWEMFDEGLHKVNSLKKIEAKQLGCNWLSEWWQEFGSLGKQFSFSKWPNCRHECNIMQTYSTRSEGWLMHVERHLEPYGLKHRPLVIVPLCVTG